MDDNAYRCSITHDVMVDPVIASDGHTYERTAIESWIKKTARSPMTQEALTSRRLTPNHFVKALIHAYMEKAPPEVKAAWSRNLVDVATSRKELDADHLFQTGKLVEAAELGHADAQAKLAMQFYDTKENALCEKYALLLDDGGNSRGAYILGMMYFREWKEDPAFGPAACEWFKQCAREFPNAYCMLAAMESDQEAKEELLLKGCRSSDPDCMFQMSEINYAKKNFRDARRTFKRVMELETTKKYDAMFQLGGMCIQGLGGKADYVRGQKYVHDAAEAGYPPAVKLRRMNTEHVFN
jgi:hypothetical protein